MGGVAKVESMLLAEQVLCWEAFCSPELQLLAHRFSLWTLKSFTALSSVGPPCMEGELRLWQGTGQDPGA